MGDDLHRKKIKWRRNGMFGDYNASRSDREESLTTPALQQDLQTYQLC